MENRGNKHIRDPGLLEPRMCDGNKSNRTVYHIPQIMLTFDRCQRIKDVATPVKYDRDI